MAQVFAVFLQIFDVTPGTGIPFSYVSLVDAVNSPARRSLDVFMAEKEFAQTGIEGESVYSMARRINHHRARAIEKITGSDLAVSSLEAVFERAVLGAIRPFAVYGEDRPDAGVGVNVRGPIQRIEH